MKFQHTTSLSIQPGILRLTSTAPAGNSMTLIPGKDANFTVTIQQIVLSWEGVTAAGQLNVTSVPSDPNPFVVYQSAGSDNIVVPFFDTVYQLGTYGLRVTNSASGGLYTATAFYTQILP